MLFAGGRSFFVYSYLRKKEAIFIFVERVKMHATLIMTKGHIIYSIKPRACCGLISVAGSFLFCMTK